MEEESLKEEILKLKKEKGIFILAHNYQRIEVQEVADFVGDSLELARKATEVKGDTIVLCGVFFMAETAKILNPGKRVLIPRIDARCPMADSVSVEEVKRLREEHPDAVVCSYVNTNAEIKALSDVCCTSANAIEVVEGLPENKVIFLPDKNLASWVKRNTHKEIIPFESFCYVHRRFRRDEVKRAKEILKGAPLLVHPECDPEVVELADEVLSTSGIERYVERNSADSFIIATEEGLLEKIKRKHPEKKIFSAGRTSVCFNMKKITLRDLLKTLREEREEVLIDEKIVEEARRALSNLLEEKDVQ